LRDDLLDGHDVLIDFVREYEDLYYRRMESWIHLVHQSIHLLTHIAAKTIRVGLLACYAQWMLETAIGNLGREIRQDHDMFANLAQCAVLRAQTNSLQACFPDIDLDVDDDDVPTPSTNLRAHTFEGYNGYAFLPRCEQYLSSITDDEHDTLMLYWNTEGWPNAETWPHAVFCWAKLLIPNGKIARSVWQETGVTTNIRRSSCVEVSPTFHYI
jgi:hypothetical protein